MSGLPAAFRRLQLGGGKDDELPRKYMTRVDVEDHIVPLWEHVSQEEAESVDRASADVALEYRYSLESFIQRSSITSEVTVSSYADDFSRLSESEVEENDIRGVYLGDLPNIRVKPGVLDPEAHPVCVEGVTIHGGTVECVDMSPYREQFAVLDYEWFLGLDYNCADRYDPDCVGRGPTFMLPFDAVGKYVFCRAHRRVEHQAVDEFSKPKVGVYDPHVSAATKAGYVPHPQFYILESLAQGSYRTEAQLHFDDDLSRGVVSSPGENGGRIELTVDFNGVTLKDRDSQQTESCSVTNMRKVYNSRVFGGDGGVASLEFADFEVEEAGKSTNGLLLSIHKCSPLVCYVFLKFTDDWKCLFTLFILSSFRCQKALGCDTEYWNSKLVDADVFSVRELFRESVFL
ncbi:hypothetical protein, conserved [Babesia bigemina]|uniref:Uncharacterized protein n=1 Tax=Babesia bigemina TaxID=5866 RepID=A0A061D8L6_BABBI|nr:hypothetical protein, conserved [Babesia bigemina]CDR97056.1 hypothetical protein, conserved [Babesia bigemina]|eukprot:XP_012769242.1 hypothetical protein, conserved [Babesia bigemina]